MCIIMHVTTAYLYMYMCVQCKRQREGACSLHTSPNCSRLISTSISPCTASSLLMGVSGNHLSMPDRGGGGGGGGGVVIRF